MLENFKSLEMRICFVVMTDYAVMFELVFNGLTGNNYLFKDLK